MAEQYEQPDAFRGATFTHADFTGAIFRDCDLTGVRIVASEVANFRVSGLHGSVAKVVVDDVDVDDFVAAELDRRHPERTQLQGMRRASDFRAMWDTVERLWSGTLHRAERRARTRGLLDALTDRGLEEIRTAVPAPAWGEESHSVRDCLSVFMREHAEHRKYAVRDLASLHTR